MSCCAIGRVADLVRGPPLTACDPWLRIEGRALVSVVTRAGLRHEQAASEGSRQVSGSRFRGDIQGLRAVAVILVLLYHAGVPFLPGGYIGVDVFFVISGFLITGLIVREVRSTGRLGLARFYARRARRLLPATALVFVFVAAMTIVVLPVTRWESIASDLAATSLYVVNWTLAARSVDYLAQGSAESPLQHFWSLAVEEQFYIVWPVLLVALIWLLRRRGRGISTGGLSAGLLVLAVPSFVWSVHLTAADPGPAYFVTTTRLWELAVGALLAVGADQVARLPQAVRSLVGWAGLATIALGAWRLTAETPFPGTAALVPTLGSAAVIVAGLGHSPGLAPLRLPAMQDIGTLSYSLYLWHWPLLVGATVLWGDDQGHLWLPTALLVVGFSAVPAWFAYRLVEQPIHTARSLAAKPWRAAVVGVVCVAIGLGSGGIVSHRAASAAAATDGSVEAGAHLGAGVLGLPVPSTSLDVGSDSPFVPAVVDAADDYARLDESYCIANLDTGARVTCEYGAEDAAVTVAVVGDSKMHQWLPALQEIADRRDWRLVTELASSCPFIEGYPVRRGQVFEACAELNGERLAAVVDDPSVDVVLVSQTAVSACVTPECEQVTAEALRGGVTAAFDRVRASGKRIVVLADNQAPETDMIECVASHPDDVGACTFPRHDDVTPLVEASRSMDVPVADVRPWVCPGDECPPVIGGVLVYRQGTHLTATYVRSMTPVLEQELVAAGMP